MTTVLTGSLVWIRDKAYIICRWKRFEIPHGEWDGGDTGGEHVRQVTFTPEYRRGKPPRATQIAPLVSEEPVDEDQTLDEDEAYRDRFGEDELPYNQNDEV